MDIVLAILPAPAHLYGSALDGIRRRLGPRIQLQTVDYPVTDRTLKELLSFWHPEGCIVFAAEGFAFSPRVFGKTPVVYLDRTPRTKGNFLDVARDYAENGQTAARELLQPEIAHYAFVGYKDATAWSQIRGDAFAKAVRLQGRTCHVFAKGAKGDRTRQLESWLLDLQKPVGLFAANDRTACEVHALCTRNVIRARACEGLTVADVAAEMGCSRRMAEMKFRQSTGRTVKDLITETRLSRTQVLIRDRGIPIPDVAKSCGYGTENAFRIAFVKRFGKSPNAARSAGT